MDIWFWRYSLVPRARLGGVARPGVREGALIRVGDGYADVHPWPELGDLPLDAQLRSLHTPLMRCSLRFAALDGAARREGRSLFDGLTIPLSHWSGNEPPAGFDTVKIKGLQPVPPDVRVRVDFNATLSASQFAALPLPDHLDFVEDPCPYDPAVWRSLRSRCRLALDRPPAVIRDRQSVDVLVVKPAVQPEWPEFDGEIVVTSYLDHPVGQMFAAYVAATHRVSDRCGLFTHVLYEANAFSDAMRADGARLLAPAGTGIGFDDLLERLPWQRLA
ncbi:MAG TPA: hypothetical protein VF698_15305 [Thermoanaerobaculia bacterium]|jgi:O-succinylbenzoate synthase